MKRTRYCKLLESMDLRSLTTARLAAPVRAAQCVRCYALMAVSHSRIGRLVSRISFDALVTNLPVCSTIGLKLCDMSINSQPITEEI